MGRGARSRVSRPISSSLGRRGSQGFSQEPLRGRGTMLASRYPRSTPSSEDASESQFTSGSKFSTSQMSVLRSPTSHTHCVSPGPGTQPPLFPSKGHSKTT